ncbi:MAG: replicative DNA helicase [Dehalococcoidales bacterium]|jgi:replicative DNA helicase|nr:replicative DNA helicase [Dehalococcoidales bacterium]
MVDRLPPHDIDAEEATLGSLLIDGTAINKIDYLIQPQDFYSERNRWVYEACLGLYQRNEAINQITVAQELARRDKLEGCGGVAFLSHLISVCPTSLEVENYARIIYRLSMMRKLIMAGEQIAGIGYQADPDVDASLDRAEDILYNLRHGRSQRDFVHIREILDKYFEAEQIQEEEGELKPSEMTHVPSGFTGLDDFLGGFQRSDLIIIAGRPSMGKTSLALNIARNAAVEHNACVAMFSLEMSKESLVERLVASEAMVNTRKIRLNNETPEEEKRILDAIGILSEAPIYIDDSPQMRVIEMRSKAKRLSFERPVNMIIIDHLGLIQSDTRIENRVQEISYITRSLKVLAREMNIPVIVVSQLSRASEWRASHKPQLSDLRDSGSIEQDADVVLFVYRDEYYYRTEEEWAKEHPNEEYPAGLADIIIAKHRNGPTGEIKLRFEHTLAKFENIATDNSPVSPEQSML